MATLQPYTGLFEGTIFKNLVSTIENIDSSKVDYSGYVMDSTFSQSQTGIDTSFCIWGNRIFMNSEDSIGTNLINLKNDETYQTTYPSLILSGGALKSDISTFIITPLIHIIYFNENIGEVVDSKTINLYEFLNACYDYTGAGINSDISYKPKATIFSSSTDVVIDDSGNQIIHFDFGGLELNDVTGDLTNPTIFSINDFILTSGLRRLNPINATHTLIETINDPLPRCAHTFARICNNHALLFGGALDKTFIQFQDFNDVTNVDYTQQLVNDFSGQINITSDSSFEHSDITSSDGSFGLEEFFTDKTTAYDFGDSTTAGEDGYYITFDSDQSGYAGNYDVRGVYIETIGGSAARFALQHDSDNTSFYDTTVPILPPFYHEQEGEYALTGSCVAPKIYLGLAKETIIRKILVKCHTQQE